MNVNNSTIDTVKIVSFFIAVAIAIYILFSWPEIIESYDSMPVILQSNTPLFLYLSIIVAFLYLILPIFWDRIRDFLERDSN